MDEPHILISPPDEDGDIVVQLKNYNPRWHLAADGTTLGAALQILAEAVLACEADEAEND